MAAKNKLRVKEKIIHEHANLIKEKENSAEMFEEKERSHAEMAKRLEEAEADMNKPIEKEKMIQEQANLIKEEENSAEMFEEKERSHAEMAKRLEESEATSTRAAKNPSETVR